MKKLLKNSKGFAMAELLAVCIIVLGIFSMLFSNYLPLLAEYENRVSYNNVTAQYASHYIRKFYINALKNDADNTFENKINQGIQSGNGVFKVYDKNNTTILTHLSANKDTIQKLIDEYQIEEIVITKYVLTDAKKSYSDETLKEYIKYLPEYKNSVYTSSNNKELYRLIIKTKNYGYATTPIIADYKTPRECFKYTSTSSSVTITGYNDNKEGCNNSNIILDNGVFTGSKKVVAIADDAFNGKAIESITLPNTVTSIGARAFKDSSLKSIDLSSIKKVGEEAFAGTQLEVITLPGNITYGNRAFADNKNLTTITFTNTLTSISATGLFEGSGTSGAGLQINTNKLTTIPEAMFKGTKIKSLTLSSSLKTIGNEAFQNVKTSDSEGLTITIPSSVTTIGENSFSGITIKSLTFTNPSTSLTIGKNSFKTSNISGGITIPANVTKIEEGAFQSSKINSLTFDTSAKLTEVGKNAFASNTFTTLELPSSINTIFEGAFSSNSKLTSVTIPSSITTIEKNAFSSCPLLGIKEGDFKNNSNSTFNWCSIFYGNSISSCITKTENGNNYISYPGEQDKIIVNGGAINE